MKKTLFLLYGVIAYFAFFGTILYTIGFVGNFIVPKTIDGIPQVSIWQAILTNAAFLTLFAVQHSVMARPAFKAWWTKYVPVPIERSTYVLFSSLILMAMMALWQPMGGVVWSIESEAVKMVLLTIYLLGWAIVFLSSFLINHFDLFGLRQVWLHFRGEPYTNLRFRVPFLYKLVRHPLYLGLLMAFWSTPHMTITHLFFAIATTGYVLVGIRLEERDLLAHFGQVYRDYSKKVPMILPTGNKKPSEAEAIQYKVSEQK